MRIQSPLSNLCDVLEQIRTSAGEYRGTLKKNEAATRAVLVDPILRALGWDTGNTFMVEVEKVDGQTRADYALYDSNGDVKVIVEAKALGGDLTHKSVILSLVQYAFNYGLQDVFLTDGMNWHHFDNFHPGNVTPAVIVNLADGNPVDSAAYLVHRLDAAKFWPERQGLDVLTQQVNQLESLVSSLRQDMIMLQTTKTSGALAELAKPCQEVNHSAARLTIDPAHYVYLDKLPDLTRKKPLAFRLPDGTEIPVAKWRDVLIHACKYTLERNASLSLPLPDRSARKVTLLSIAKPAIGISYVQEQYQGQTIFIYTNYSANSCIANAQYILDMAPPHQRVVMPALAIAEG